MNMSTFVTGFKPPDENCNPDGCDPQAPCALLLIDGHWSNEDDIRVCADNANDGYERSLDWPEPAELKEVWAELDKWRSARDDEIARLDAEVKRLRDAALVLINGGR